MINALRHLFRPRPTRPLPAVPVGTRVYAIGDIHGRLDLLTALVAAIEADDAARAAADTTIVLLGDLIDRGPDSAAVIAAARDLQRRRPVRIVAGNHEEKFLDSFTDVDVVGPFLRYGGYETLQSYAVDPDALRRATFEEAQALMREAVPEADLAFLRGLEECVVIGDYLFVHAGIRPGAPLDEQQVHDMRWIREPFLSHDGDHGHVVVHGHTICAEPEVLHNRIGIDTGAFRSGRLTALGLGGSERWLIEACDNAGRIIASGRPI